MKQYVNCPAAEKRRSEAVERVSFYGINDATLFSMFTGSVCYGHFSFYMEFVGIAGWPVPQLWNEMRETCRDMQG